MEEIKAVTTLEHFSRQQRVALALAAALPASNAGSKFYQPQLVALVKFANAPVIQVDAPSPTNAPELVERIFENRYQAPWNGMNPYRPFCTAANGRGEMQ